MCPGGECFVWFYFSLTGRFQLQLFTFKSYRQNQWIKLCTTQPQLVFEDIHFSYEVQEWQMCTLIVLCSCPFIPTFHSLWSLNTQSKKEESGYKERCNKMLQTGYKSVINTARIVSTMCSFDKRNIDAKFKSGKKIIVPHCAASREWDWC